MVFGTSREQTASRSSKEPRQHCNGNKHNSNHLSTTNLLSNFWLTFGAGWLGYFGWSCWYCVLMFVEIFALTLKICGSIFINSWSRSWEHLELG